VQQAVWQYGWVTNIFSAIGSLIGISSSRQITPGNRISNELLSKHLAAVTGRRFSNTATSPSPIVVCHLRFDIISLVSEIRLNKFKINF